jgi:hypothetical protein
MSYFCGSLASLVDILFWGGGFHIETFESNAVAALSMERNVHQLLLRERREVV